MVTDKMLEAYFEVLHDPNNGTRIAHDVYKDAIQAAIDTAEKEWVDASVKLPSAMTLVMTDVGIGYVNLSGVWYSHLSALGMGVRCSIGAVTKWRELSRGE